MYCDKHDYATGQLDGSGKGAYAVHSLSVSSERMTFVLFRGWLLLGHFFQLELESSRLLVATCGGAKLCKLKLRFWLRSFETPV